MARFLGLNPHTGAEVFARSGLYGAYVQQGLDGDPAMRRMPLMKARARGEGGGGGSGEVAWVARPRASYGTTLLAR